MLAARQLEIVENCRKRAYQSHKERGDISSEIVRRLGAFAIPAYHPKGTILFVEGQPSRGVFIVCSGGVKLFTSSAEGKTVILRFASPGEILGLAGTLSGKPYEVWAQTTQATQTRFVERERFVEVMRRHSGFALQVANQLAESYCSGIAGMLVMGYSRPASQKLARFFLDWYKSNRTLHEEDGARLTLTHEEIAQAIGTSRETVTRLLSGFKKKGLIQWKGCNLVLTDRAALESSAAN